jgi:hypothetical protein
MRGPWSYRNELPPNILVIIREQPRSQRSVSAMTTTDASPSDERG